MISSLGGDSVKVEDDQQGRILKKAARCLCHMLTEAVVISQHASDASSQPQLLLKAEFTTQ
jgi:hypothetical protein